MKHTKDLINTIILIPNIPFIISVSLYIFVQDLRNKGTDEMERLNREPLSEEVKERIKVIYPIHLRVFIAIAFYAYIFMKILFTIQKKTKLFLSKILGCNGNIDILKLMLLN